MNQNNLLIHDQYDALLAYLKGVGLPNFIRLNQGDLYERTLNQGQFMVALKFNSSQREHCESTSVSYDQNVKIYTLIGKVGNCALFLNALSISENGHIIDFMVEKMKEQFKMTAITTTTTAAAAATAVTSIDGPAMMTRGPQNQQQQATKFSVGSTATEQRGSPSLANIAWMKQQLNQMGVVGVFDEFLRSMYHHLCSNTEAVDRFMGSLVDLGVFDFHQADACRVKGTSYAQLAEIYRIIMVKNEGAKMITALHNSDNGHICQYIFQQLKIFLGLPNDKQGQMDDDSVLDVNTRLAESLSIGAKISNYQTTAAGTPRPNASQRPVQFPQPPRRDNDDDENATLVNSPPPPQQTPPLGNGEVGTPSNEASYKLIQLPLPGPKKVDKNVYGLALIINIYYYVLGSIFKSRKGSDVDVKNLVTSFQNFGIGVVVPENYENNENFKVTEDIFDDWMDQFKEMFVQGKTRVCFVVVMGHGDWNDTLCMSNGKDSLSIEKHVFTVFNNNNFREMINQPKIFIMNCCRGDAPAPPVKIKEVLDGRESEVCGVTDMAMMWSTTRGNSSARHEKTGSRFIIVLCEYLKKYLDCLTQQGPHAGRRRLDDIFDAVAWKLKDLTQYPPISIPETNVKTTQTGTLEKCTFGQFYWLIDDCEYLHPALHENF